MPQRAASPPSEPVRHGHVEANGVRYWYEVRGEGEPLLLLHGGLGSFEMLRPLLPSIGAGREVIGVDLHGHGRTALGNREIRLAAMGDDLDLLLEALGFGSVDVLGYSLGGSVALRLAVQHPARVRRLVVVSSGFARDGLHPELLASQEAFGSAFAESLRETPIYRAYAAMAPSPEEFPALLDRIGESMRRPYDWSEEVRGLEMPVMLVFGDGDMYRLDHVVEFYRLLGGGLRDAGWTREHRSRSRLAILPDVTHYDILHAPALPAAVLPFLATP